MISLFTDEWTEPGLCVEWLTVQCREDSFILLKKGVIFRLISHNVININRAVKTDSSEDKSLFRPGDMTDSYFTFSRYNTGCCNDNNKWVSVKGSLGSISQSARLFIWSGWSYPIGIGNFSAYSLWLLRQRSVGSDRQGHIALAPFFLEHLGVIPLITVRLTYLLFWCGSEAVHRLLGHLISLGVSFRLWNTKYSSNWSSEWSSEIF